MTLHAYISDPTRTGKDDVLMGTVTPVPVAQPPVPGLSTIALEVMLRVISQAFDTATYPQQNFAWLPDVYSLVHHGRLEDAGDLVFSKIDDLLCSGEFRRCDELLHMVDPKRLDINVMLSFLSITFAAKHKLPGRTSLVRRIEARLQQIVPNRVAALLAPLR